MNLSKSPTVHLTVMHRPDTAGAQIRRDYTTGELADALAWLIATLTPEHPPLRRRLTACPGLLGELAAVLWPDMVTVLVLPAAHAADADRILGSGITPDSTATITGTATRFGRLLVCHPRRAVMTELAPLLTQWWDDLA